MLSPILTRAEHLIIENQVAILDALSVICVMIPYQEVGNALEEDKLKISHILHMLADNSRLVLEKSK